MYNMSKDFEEEEPKVWDLLVVVVICSLALLGSWVVFENTYRFVTMAIDRAFVTESELEESTDATLNRVQEIVSSKVELPSLKCTRITCVSHPSIMSRIEALEASIKN